MINLCLEFDDLHFDPEVNCLQIIEKYIELFPSIKLSFFTIPCYKSKPLFHNLDWCQKISSYIEQGNIELEVHGFDHSFLEFKNISYGEAITRLTTGEEIFKQSNLPFKKIFRGPYWGINKNTYKALIDLDYSKVFTHKDYSNLIPEFNISSIIYNQNLADKLEAQPTIIAHGHTHNVCNNGIEETFNKVSQFIENNEINFVFCSELD